jgi:hypothetical protein
LTECGSKDGRTDGYRVDVWRPFAYLPDLGPAMLGAGPRAGTSQIPRTGALAEGAGEPILDAHLRVDELSEQALFGDATAEYAVELPGPAVSGRSSCSTMRRTVRTPSWSVFGIAPRVLGTCT